MWAGWGHASENPALPEALARESAEVGHQVQWIGPPPSAMRALGDKISSTLIAQTAGISSVNVSCASTKQNGFRCAVFRLEWRNN